MIKKLILLGFGLTLLIGLPLAIFVLQNQTQTQSGAAPVTKFSFSGPSQVDSGANFDENLVVDPGGSNQVSFVKFTFTYDPNFIDKQATPVTIDTSKYTVLEQPTVNCATLCTVTATLSIGSNQSAVIKSATTVAVIHLVGKTDTDNNGTQLAFVTGQNQALSVGSSDQAAENVFQSGTPATVVIGAAGGGGGSGTPTDTVSPTDSGGGGTTPTDTPVPGGGGGGGGGGTSASVTCSSFTADKTSGTAPLTVTFTTVGTSSTDSITQLDLTYGDGSTDTIASGSGLGTGDINNQISHSYSSNGIFTAYAILTTASGATSDKSTCTQSINVGQITPTAKPSLPPTGPGQTFVLLGAAGAVLTAIGLIVIAGL